MKPLHPSKSSAACRPEAPDEGEQHRAEALALEESEQQPTQNRAPGWIAPKAASGVGSTVHGQRSSEEWRDGHDRPSGP